MTNWRIVIILFLSVALQHSFLNMYRVLRFSVFFFTIVSSAFRIAPAQLPGDANGDSLVDLLDAACQVRYLFSQGPPPRFWECGDPTGDCQVDLEDLLCLLNFLFRHGPDPQIVECGWSEPINLGSPINSRANDRSISFSSDWRRLALASTRTGSLGNEDLWYSVWDDDSAFWQEPQNCGRHINTVIRDDQPCISADGNRIYYSIWGRPGGQGDWDIWVITFDGLDNRWGAPENLGRGVNSRRSETRPFISFDGSRLYFSSGRYPGGIFVSNRKDQGWGEPVCLGPNVNKQFDECEPAVTADRRALYFVRWTQEGTDFLRRIWVSYRTDTEWGPSFKLGPSVNYPHLHATDPWISPDGSRLYFSMKSKPGGLGGYDIWVSERLSSEPGKPFINREAQVTEREGDNEE